MWLPQSQARPQSEAHAEKRVWLQLPLKPTSWTHNSPHLSKKPTDSVGFFIVLQAEIAGELFGVVGFGERGLWIGEAIEHESTQRIVECAHAFGA
jgi:hypothetical protein